MQQTGEQKPEKALPTPKGEGRGKRCLRFKRCGNQLQGKQTHYCSVRCQKLYLKSRWRKQNRKKCNAYLRQWRLKRHVQFDL